jgi:methyltransferase-like protein/predicted O-methyltransferase YrrM
MNTNIYDEIPYTRHIYKQTQPDNLATFATLLGMQAPPVETCRVLELGCASGINLIAMAQAIPEGKFIGIDYSEQQINIGQALIEQIGLDNITLKHQDIMAFDEELGLFDYIVAHGVYSWVAPEVRDKVLQICHAHLQANGVAYVSYNVYPGWHLDKMLRQMVLYHTKNVKSPKEKLKQAKALLKFFVDSIKQKYDSYSLSLKKELQYVSELDEHYLFHEYLEEYNDPVFFSQFMEHASSHGLQYLIDTRNPFTTVENVFADEAKKLLEIKLIEREQYFDFLRNNAFRETLLCHEHLTLNRHLEAHKISDFYIAAPLKPASKNLSADTAETLKQKSLEQFQNLSGEAVLSVGSLVLKAVCLCLGEAWPQSLSFERLIFRVEKLLSLVQEKPFQDSFRLSQTAIDEIKTMLLTFYLKHIVELSVYPPEFTLRVDEYPIASPIARLQSEQGKAVTNLRYEVFTLNSANRLILRHLDGQHDRSGLLEVMRKSIKAGDFILSQDDNKVTLDAVKPKDLQDFLSHQLDEILQNLAKKAYLI